MPANLENLAVATGLEKVRRVKKQSEKTGRFLLGYMLKISRGVPEV